MYKNFTFYFCKKTNAQKLHTEIFYRIKGKSNYVLSICSKDKDLLHGHGSVMVSTINTEVDY